MTKFIAGAKMGDFIHSLYVVKNLCDKTGEKATIYLAEKGDQWVQTIHKAYRDCCQLVAAQPYVESFVLQEGRDVSGAIDLSRWRYGERIGCWSEFLSAKYQFPTPRRSKWLMSPGANPLVAGKLLICRSRQHHNPSFPWGAITSRHDVMFLQAKNEEWDEFEPKGNAVPLYCSTITEMAAAISSCRLFVGNQSCPFAVACALDVPRLGELDQGWEEFYVGEEKYSDNVSWFVSDTSRYLSSTVLSILGGSFP